MSDRPTQGTGRRRSRRAQAPAGAPRSAQQRAGQRSGTTADRTTPDQSPNPAAVARDSAKAPIGSAAAEPVAQPATPAPPEPPMEDPAAAPTGAVPASEVVPEVAEHPDHAPEVSGQQEASGGVPPAKLVASQADSPTTADESSAWSRLGKLGRPRVTKANVLAALLALVLGFAMVTQVRETRTSELENLRQADLVSLLASVNNQSSRLNKDITDLTTTRDGLASSTDDAAAVRAARDRLDSLGILAGTVKATGPGIKIVINDPNAAISAPNLLDAVQELRGAGAEAIQIGDVRVVANSWFGTTQGGKVMVDGKEVRAPYTIVAIGDSHTMSTAMAIPGGVTEQLKQIKAQPTILNLGKVEVTALRPVSPPRYSQRDDEGS